jgi:hypothetical protein
MLHNHLDSGSTRKRCGLLARPLNFALAPLLPVAIVTVACAMPALRATRLHSRETLDAD